MSVFHIFKHSDILSTFNELIMFIVHMFEMLENLQNNDFKILSVEGMPWNSQIFYDFIPEVGKIHHDLHFFNDQSVRTF